MVTSTLFRYYQVLGVPEQASLEELKQAYRQKAKQLHPDRNKAPEAHRDFILLNEAYEYLLNLKTNKRPLLSDQGVAEARYRQEWYRQERVRARQRAQAYAQMQYEEFLKSDQYKLSSSWATIGAHAYYFFAIAVLGVLPLVATFLFGRKGFLVSLLVMGLTSPLTIDAIRNKPVLDFRMLGRALLYVMQTGSFQVVAVTAINLALILKVGLQTLVPPGLLLGAFIAAILVAFALAKWWRPPKSRFRHYFYTFCAAPFLLNLLLLVNYTFSRHPVEETYLFRQVLQSTRSGMERSTLIELQDNKYAGYPGIRVFWSYSAMDGYDQITYTFRDGLLGLRVMTNHYFHEQED
jgi:hypothetical protein